MALQGNLRDMGVADLIQQTCQDRKSAFLTIRHDNSVASLYFKEGQVVHAKMGLQSGEEIVYRILAWEDGSFSLENDIEPPMTSIQRSWSGLLMEGARRLDEGRAQPAAGETPLLETKQSEVKYMASQLQEVLKGLGNEVNGYMASAVIGLDGISIAHDMHSSKADVDSIGAQTALLIKLVDTSAAKLQAGSLEDTLLTTENALVLIRFLESKRYFLTVVVDKRSASLGNLRLMSRIYADRVSKAIPR